MSVAAAGGVRHGKASRALDILGGDGEVAAAAGYRLQLGGVYSGGVPAGDRISAVGFARIVQSVDRLGAVLGHRQACRRGECDIGGSDDSQGYSPRSSGPAGGGVVDCEAFVAGGRGCCRLDGESAAGSRNDEF